MIGDGDDDDDLMLMVLSLSLAFDFQKPFCPPPFCPPSHGSWIGNIIRQEFSTSAFSAK